MEKLARYLGPDNEWRSPYEHHKYLLECAKLWREAGDDQQAFRVRLLAIDVAHNHRGEFRSLV